MADSVLKIFSYLPNPRVWKAQIAAEIIGVQIEVVGDKPAALPGWLWDFQPDIFKLYILFRFYLNIVQCIAIRFQTCCCYYIKGFVIHPESARNLPRGI